MGQCSAATSVANSVLGYTFTCLRTGQPIAERAKETVPERLGRKTNLRGVAVARASLIGRASGTYPAAYPGRSAGRPSVKCAGAGVVGDVALLASWWRRTQRRASSAPQTMSGNGATTAS